MTGTPYVPASPKEYGTIVACGQIAKTGLDGKLAIRLASVGDASVAGVAVIQKGKGLSLNLGKGSFGFEEDQVKVTVYLTRL